MVTFSCATFTAIIGFCVRCHKILISHCTNALLIAFIIRSLGWKSKNKNCLYVSLGVFFSYLNAEMYIENVETLIQACAPFFLTQKKEHRLTRKFTLTADLLPIFIYESYTNVNGLRTTSAASALCHKETPTAVVPPSDRP